MTALKFHIAMNCLAETLLLGGLLGQAAEPGDVYCLDGDLGAGKTTLSQAIAQGLGVPPDTYVSSPSFAIMHEYPGRLSMYHMDFYRLGSGEEVAELGLDEYFFGSGLCVIEWAGRAEEYLPESRINLHLKVVGEEERELTVDVPETASGKMETIIDIFKRERDALVK